MAQVFVAVGDEPREIAGTYSVSTASFRKEDLPPDFAKRLPHYPVPAAVLGQLAVDRAEQGRSLGETLLLDAIRRVASASTKIAIYAMIVDAKDDRAQAFYGRYGFRTFTSAPPVPAARDLRKARAVGHPMMSFQARNSASRPSCATSPTRIAARAGA